MSDSELSVSTDLLGFPPVLDACCGSRMFWFDKQDDRALFVDKRRETWPIDIGTPGTKGRSPIVVDPDELADFTALPYPDAVFSLVVFDPPHIERTGLVPRQSALRSSCRGATPAQLPRHCAKPRRMAG